MKNWTVCEEKSHGFLQVLFHENHGVVSAGIAVSGPIIKPRPSRIRSTDNAITKVYQKVSGMSQLRNKPQQQ
jgi:hypothetical protein